MTTSIKVDVSRALQGLRDVRANQIPYATSRAINDVAFSAREKLIAQAQSRFKFRTGTAWVRSGGPAHRGWFSVTPSSKRNLIAQIQTQYDYLYLQEYGGMEKSHRGGSIAVPLGDLNRRFIPANLRPRFLLGQDTQGLLMAQARALRFSNSRKAGTYGKGFLLKSGGRTFIAQRTGKRTVVFRYVLVPAIRNLSRLGMISTVQQVVKGEFNAAFTRRMREAMASAR